MKKFCLIIISLVLSLFIGIVNVSAIKVTDAGDIVNEVGNYESSRFIAGNNVESKATIDGISFVAGNSLELEGTAGYGFYAGNNVTVNSNIEKDAFIAGNKIKIDTEATIGRDLYIAGSDIKIKANITRDLRAGGDTIDIRGITIGGNAYIASDKIILDENTIINGKLTYPQESKIDGLEEATITEVKAVKGSELTINNNFKNKAKEFLQSAIAAFAILVVLFFLIPSSKERLDKLELSLRNVVKYIGIGLVALIVVPFAAILLLFTGILAPLSIIILFLYVICLLLASLPIYYIVGKLLTEKVFKIDNTYIALGYGILLVKFIKLIPILGEWVSILAFLFGFGLIFMFIKNRK
jgi:hypothetical protein